MFDKCFFLCHSVLRKHVNNDINQNYFLFTRFETNDDAWERTIQEMFINVTGRLRAFLGLVYQVLDDPALLHTSLQLKASSV